MNATARNGRPGLAGPLPHDLLALTGGLVLVVLGLIAARALAETWGAVAWAASSEEAQSLRGPGWYTGDGSAVSRGRWWTGLVTPALLCGLPLVATTAYGVRQVIAVVARQLGRPRGPRDDR